MVFLLLGRRRRKHKREEDPGISYHNPYYGEVKPRPAARRDSGTDYEEEEEDVGYLANDFSLHGLLDMYGAGAVGGATESEVNKKLLVAPEKSEKGVGSTSLKEPPPPSPLHVRPKCVMNTYDTPPSLASHRPAAVAAATKKHKSPHAKLTAGCELPDKKKKKRGNGRDGKKKEEEVEEENYYDEVGPMAPTAYDVPPVGGRRAHHMATARLPLLPKTTATTTNKSSSSSSFPPRVSSPSFPPCAEDLYYNDQDEEMEENVYESVENLREAIGQQRGVLQLHNEALVGAAHGGATGVEGGNLYVPFVLDEVKDQ
ncbi:uncharacterized protein LOC101861258 [Aplysia californica]|uniref:Uncharacterized protein LOC101861258 n=1 Tax=Aplysia californica TaxID=6500 RepID=A0ABM0JD54_APLCA|nr:uncharacterized protein LOC101861258 [Aplysia californica]